MGAVNGPGRLIRGMCDACLLSFPPSRPEISRWRCARGMAHRRRRRPAGSGERFAPARLEPAEAVEEPTGSATALRASARSRCPPPSPRFPRPWQAVSAARPGQEGSRMRASSLRLMAGFKLAAHGLRGVRTASRASSWRLEALLAVRTPPFHSPDCVRFPAELLLRRALASWAAKADWQEFAAMWVPEWAGFGWGACAGS